MRIGIVTFLLIVFFSLCTAQDIQKPAWVVHIQQKGTAPDFGMDVYYGIGVSDLTPGDADASARKELASMIVTRVRSVQKKEEKEEQGKMESKYELSVEAITDTVLKGIAISERYVNDIPPRYYSLIRIGKTDYDNMAVEERRREVEKRKALNAEDEKERQEALRKRQADLELTRLAEEQAKREEEFKKQRYADFLKIPAHEKVVSLYNSEFVETTHRFSLGGWVSPLSFRNAGYGFRFWKMELSAYVASSSDSLYQAEAKVKIQILQGVGELTKLGVAIGYMLYTDSLILDNTGDVILKQSPFFSANMAFPGLLYSHASMYADFRKVSFGLNSYPLFSSVKNAISLLLQVNYIWNAPSRNRHNDPITVEGGLRLRASNDIGASFTYERNEFFVLTLDFGF